LSSPLYVGGDRIDAGNTAPALTEAEVIAAEPVIAAATVTVEWPANWGAP
jgi:hypothetical protein